MAPSPDAWPERDRHAFWSLVRGYMAQRGLRQDDVARALHLDRSVLSRRLTGRIKSPPDPRMVEQIAAVLSLGPDEIARLRQLAGHPAPAGAPQGEPAASSAVALVPPQTPPPRRTTWLRSGLLMVGGAALAALAALLSGVAGSKPVQPGGVWIGPRHGEAVSKPIHFAARAYPGNRAAPAIAFVEFTVSWEGRPGPWLVACQVRTPTHTDLYECDFDPATVGVPPGQLRVSFDVYDERERVNLAPHGVRSVTYRR